MNANDLDELAAPYYTARAIRTLDVIHPSFSVVSSMIAFPCSVTSLPSRGYFLSIVLLGNACQAVDDGLLGTKIGPEEDSRPLKID